MMPEAEPAIWGADDDRASAATELHRALLARYKGSLESITKKRPVAIILRISSAPLVPCSSNAAMRYAVVRSTARAGFENLRRNKFRRLSQRGLNIVPLLIDAAYGAVFLTLLCRAEFHDAVGVLTMPRHRLRSEWFFSRNRRCLLRAKGL